MRYAGDAMSHPRPTPTPAQGCRVPAGLARVLDEAGLSAEAVSRRAHLPPETLVTPRVRLPVDVYFDLWRAIGAVAGDATIGLQLAACYPAHLLEPGLLVCLGSRDLRDALDRLVRYKGTLCPEELVVDQRAGRVHLRHRWPTARQRPPAVLEEAELAFLAYLSRQATGRALADIELRSTRSGGDPAAFVAVFGAPVQLGAHQAVLSLPVEVLEWPFSTFSPALVAALEPALEAELARPRPASAGAAYSVRRAVARRLGAGDISIGAVAAELGTSSRTLQRRLRAAGTRFGAVLEDVRRDRAVFYLRETDLSTAEIAFLLGFDRPSSFFRAFARWLGRTPGDYRRVHGSRDG